MKRLILTALLVGMAGGCVQMDSWLKEKTMADLPSPETAPRRSRLVVNPAEVNERNAREMADALRRELEQVQPETVAGEAPPRPSRRSEHQPSRQFHALPALGDCYA